MNLCRIKRLDLEFWHWFEYEEGTLESNYPELKRIVPVIGRDGQYYDRITKTYWFEIHGLAYLKPKEEGQFLWSLAHLNHRRLREIEYKAIHTLIVQKICPQSLRDTYEKEKHIRELRKILTDTFRRQYALNR